jgi:twitching motility protein PilT
MDYKQELDKLILNVIREGGSDLHLGVGRYPAMRVNRSLIFLKTLPILTYETMIEYLKIMLGEEKIEIFLKDQEVDFAYTYVDTTHKTRLRGNAFVQKGNLVIALRIIPKVSTFEELNLPPVLEMIAKKRQGFFSSCWSSWSR